MRDAWDTLRGTLTDVRDRLRDARGKSRDTPEKAGPAKKASVMYCYC